MSVAVNLIFWFGIRLLFAIFYCLSFGPLTGYYRLVQGALNLLFFSTGTRLKLVGAERLPGEGPLLLVCNQPRRLTPLYLIAALPPGLKFVAAAGIFRFPIVGRVIRTMGALPHSGSQRDKGAGWLYAGRLYRALGGGGRVVVFYENIREKKWREKGRVDRLLAIARQSGARVVPLFIELAGRGNGGNRDIFLLGEVKITVGEPDPPALEPLFEPLMKNLIIDASFPGAGPID